MKLFAVHGWGFDAAVWDRLADCLPEWEMLRADRGYFGVPAWPEVEGPCIAVTHSFGAMALLAHPPAGCAGLVAINGFDRFTADGERPGVAPRVVTRMMARFGTDPAAVLKDFRGRIGVSDAAPEPQSGPLLADLRAMRDDDCSAAVKGWKILAIDGDADPLLPAEMRAVQFAAAAAERLTIGGAGHLLPITHAAECAAHIRRFAEALS